jgi:hypothetical protein
LITRVWEDRQTGRAPDTDPLDIELTEIPAGQVVCVESVAITDVDTKGKTALIGYSDGSKIFWFCKKDMPNTDYSIQWWGRLYLSERHRIVAQIYNPTSGDDILLVANGVFA